MSGASPGRAAGAPGAGPSQGRAEAAVRAAAAACGSAPAAFGASAPPGPLPRPPSGPSVPDALAPLRPSRYPGQRTGIRRRPRVAPSDPASLRNCGVSGAATARHCGQRTGIRRAARLEPPPRPLRWPPARRRQLLPVLGSDWCPGTRRQRPPCSSRGQRPRRSNSVSVALSPVAAGTSALPPVPAPAGAQAPPPRLHSPEAAPGCPPAAPVKNYPVSPVAAGA